MRIIRVVIFWGVFAGSLYLLKTPEWAYKWGALAMACLAEISIYKNYGLGD